MYTFRFELVSLFARVFKIVTIKFLILILVIRIIFIK